MTSLLLLTQKLSPISSDLLSESRVTFLHQIDRNIMLIISIIATESNRLFPSTRRGELHHELRFGLALSAISSFFAILTLFFSGVCPVGLGSSSTLLRGVDFCALYGKWGCEGKLILYKMYFHLITYIL
jgi:hypothetical protein